MLGNPPYVFSRENLTEKDKSILKSIYKLTQFKINLYVLFIELGYNLISKHGELFYITPNNWLSLDKASDLRKFILDNTFNIKIVQNYSNVFQNASVDTLIIGFKKCGTSVLEYLEWVDNKPLLKQSEAKEKYLNKPGCILSISTNTNTNSIINKITGVELSDYCDVKNGVQAYTVGEGYPICTEEIRISRAYHSKQKHDENWIEYLDGVDVSRYHLNWSGQFIKYGKNLARPRQCNLFTDERILVRQIPNKLPYCINAVYTDKRYINDNNSMIIKITDSNLNIKYLLGLLNSKLLSYWFAQYFGKLSRKIFPQFKINELRIFPIRIAENQQPLIDLVNEILAAKKENVGADVSEVEREIDRLVYGLYGVSAEEVGVIEG